MYTSGTTGLPKGAVLRRGAIAADLDGLAEAWEWTADDTLVHGLPLFHVHGLVLGVLGALRVGIAPDPHRPADARRVRGGGRIAVLRRPDRVVAGLRRPAAARDCAAPACWSRAARRCRCRSSSSGRADRPVARRAVRDDRDADHPVDAGRRRAPAGHVGLPIDGSRPGSSATTARPRRHDGESIGELQVRGPTLFSSYLGQPEATAASFDDGWFVTGDAATIGPDGFHRIVGRKSIDIIKSGGYKVGAGEVEAALLAHPGVSEAAVVGVADDDLGQRIVAFVVADGVDGATLVDVRRRTALGPQATARGARRRSAAAQRDGQGAEEPARAVTGPSAAARRRQGAMQRVTSWPMPSISLTSSSPGLRKIGGLRA